MNVIQTKIPEVLVIEPKIYRDKRGFFLEAYQDKRYKSFGINHRFVQDNHSGSSRGVLRGIHYQLKHPQGKLVRVIKGGVYDVAVDLRQHSPTFGAYVGIILSENNYKQLWIPPGFGHGFYVLSEWAEFIYKVTDIYSPDWERTIQWNDPDIMIDWPILEGEKIILSEKDLQGIPLKEAEVFE